MGNDLIKLGCLIIIVPVFAVFVFTFIWIIGALLFG